jgi:uncharacterized protein with beta-barrel porin domain
VGFLDGANNLLTNNGLVTSVNQIGGFAMTATTGNDTLDNFGTVTGSVDLGTGTNAFLNETGALFNMGATVMLGAGNTMTNSGTMSPGGIGNVFTSAVTGNVVQTATGNYVVDVDLKPQTADALTSTGTGNFAGNLSPNFLNKGNAKPGTQTYTVFSAAGVTTNSGLALNAQPRAVVTYALTFPNVKDIVFGYTINFNPTGMPSQYQSIGSAINAIQTAGVPGFVPIAAALFDVPNLNALKAFYDAVGGGGTASTQQSAIGAGEMFNSLFVDQTAAWLSGNYGGSSVFLDEPALGYAANELSYARNETRLSAAQSAFGDIRAQAPASFTDRWRMWFAPFGSHRIDAADPAAGSPGSTIANI